MTTENIDILLLNLGTPSAPTQKAVKRYLQEFLLDERVIDIRNPWRWLFVKCLLVPFRSKTTTHAYQKIWEKKGSPLLLNSQKLSLALGEHLGASYRVWLGMNYGDPTIENILSDIAKQSCKQLIIVPLYPQYASATQGAALEKTLRILAKYHNFPKLTVINHFYDHPAFIFASANLIQDYLKAHEYDLLLFSYHGLPERHIHKSGCIEHLCPSHQTCRFPQKKSYCYRQHCYATTQLITEQLNLKPEQYCVSFQSRIGQLPWIKPYTHEVLTELRAQGVEKLAVVCPSFICDCLETLEEIGIRLREQWQALGGNTFTLIPCLNDNPEWVSGLAKMIQEQAS